MKFITTNYNTPCPICQDTSGDCRLTQEDLVLCHSFIGGDSGVAGYSFRKTSKNGVWGTHVKDNGKRQNKEQYERYLEIKKEQERDRSAFLASHALSEEKRDKAIRAIAQHVGLNEEDKQSLLGRGLSEEQIEKGLFFSVDPWKKINLPDLPENLPGADARNGRFTTRESGYACVAFNSKGQAIGWQIRLLEGKGGNKYRWAKSLYSSHLGNGELPITNCHASECGQAQGGRLTSTSGSSKLYFTEGILKPYVAASLFGIDTCGAAGGYFHGGQSQVKKAVKSEHDTIVIVPDAGDVLNKNVIDRWEKQHLFLKQFDLPIKVLWWGQIDKDKHKDIDEISLKEFSEAKEIEFEEFLKISNTQIWIKSQWELWEKYKTFTPQRKVEKQFIDFELPLPNTMTFIKSGLGTGKTTQLVEILKLVEKDYGIMGIGYRNTLLLQFNERAKEIGFYHLQSDKNLKEFNLNRPDIKVTSCVDSLIHYKAEHFDGKIIVLDEVASIVKHLLYSRTIKNFPLVRQMFIEMVKRCDRLICLDGFMQDWVIDFFRSISPEKTVLTLENTYSKNKAEVFILDGTVNIKKKYRLNDRSPWLEGMFASDRPVICSDSQVFCEAIDKLFIAEGKKGVRVDSKTVCEKPVKEFFTNPNQWIEENQPDYLIYSPSAESGLDISKEDYFKEHYAFFFGAIDTDSCIQMLGRLRDPKVPKYVWAKKFLASDEIGKRPCNHTEIEAERLREVLREANDVLSCSQLPTNNSGHIASEEVVSRLLEIIKNTDGFTNAADTIAAVRNHEVKNYRDCLIAQLKSSGYPTEPIKTEAPLSQMLINDREKVAKDEVKLQNSKDIFDASDRYIGKTIANLSYDASWEARCEVTKATIVAQLPKINETSVWSPEFIKYIKYDKPNIIKQNKLFYLLNNLDVAKREAEIKYNTIYNSGEAHSPWKLKQEYLKLKTLNGIGILDFIKAFTTASADEDGEFPSYDSNTLGVKNIIASCKKSAVSKVLGSPGRSPVKFLNTLLLALGIKTRARRVREGDKVTSVYRIDKHSFYGEYRAAILEAIHLKYVQKTEYLNEPLIWSNKTIVLKPKLNKNPMANIDPANSPQTHAVQGLDPVTDDTFFSNQKVIICHTDIERSEDSNLNPGFKTTPILHRMVRVSVFDTLDSTQELGEFLGQCECAEDLLAIAETPEFTRDRLNRACKLLDSAQLAKIKAWAQENKDKPKAPPKMLTDELTVEVPLVETWDAVSDVAEMLDNCQSFEEFKEIIDIPEFTQKAFEFALKLLKSKDKQSQYQQWFLTA